jgi:anaerobic selenocysteine-containing dehydrogenase
VVRRAKDTLNSLGRRVGDDVRTNPCWVHPDDLERLALAEGAIVRLTSDHGSVRAVIGADATLRPGVVALTHAYGALPGDGDDPARLGASVSLLLSLRDDLQPVSRMPHMSAVPVSIEADRSSVVEHG